ncbi:PqiC family protein [Crenobacter sp. SG2303]|uniref:PqiC family protein n=1 Tax=Crenobacter oryzisoli TaxID=3056844 RepID=A0ABT7XTP9_9NEIS|nr:PqiC family protein [Crenobacter sp. SG2303]MDN0077172.1 PqiC family protein [Crenobacter sp. SG2303]
MIRLILFVILALFAALLEGCSSSPKASFYTLSPAATLAPSGAAMPLHVVVSPVTVPDLVDRPQIVTRLAGDEVALNEFARWAAPLKSDIARVIAADLAQQLGSDHVSMFDSGSDTASTWRVRVDIVRFDSVPGTAVTVEALWTVRPPGRATPVLGRTVAQEPVKEQGYGALVAGHDRALATVSRDIASAIRTNQPH